MAATPRPVRQQDRLTLDRSPSFETLEPRAAPTELLTGAVATAAAAAHQPAEVRTPEARTAVRSETDRDRDRETAGTNAATPARDQSSVTRSADIRRDGPAPLTSLASADDLAEDFGGEPQEAAGGFRPAAAPRSAVAAPPVQTVTVDPVAASPAAYAPQAFGAAAAGRPSSSDDVAAAAWTAHSLTDVSGTSDPSADPARTVAAAASATPTTDAGGATPTTRTAAAAEPGGTTPTQARPKTKPADGAEAGPPSGFALASFAVAQTGPVWVLDHHDGLTLSTDAQEHDFAGSDVDLRVQLDPGSPAVTGVAWDLSAAAAATGVVGAGGRNLSFTWDANAPVGPLGSGGEPQVQVVGLTVDFADGSQVTHSYDFVVRQGTAGYGGKATGGSVGSGPGGGPDGGGGTGPGDGGGTGPGGGGGFPEDVWLGDFAHGQWDGVVTPDRLRNEHTAAGDGYRIGTASGAVHSRHQFPAHDGQPPLALAYSSHAAAPRPVFTVRHELDPTQAVPDTIAATLTLDGVAGQTFHYDTAGFSPGDFVHLSLQADAAALATGRYDWSIDLTEDRAGLTAVVGHSGRVSVVHQAGTALGRGWTFENLERAHAATDGVLIEQAYGESLFFASDGSGGYGTPQGDFSTLAAVFGGGWTRTLQDGAVLSYDAAGYLTARTARDGDATTYAYASGRLTGVTDPNGRATSLVYNPDGTLASVVDPGGRSTLLAHDAGMLADVRAPKGSGFAEKREFRYTAYADGGVLDRIVTPTDDATDFTYDGFGHVDSVTRADASTAYLDPYWGQGLLAAGTATTAATAAGATLAATAAGSYTDGRGGQWTRQYDWTGYGRVTVQTDPAGARTTIHRDADGLVAAHSDRLDRHRFVETGETGLTTRAVEPAVLVSLQSTERHVSPDRTFEYGAFADLTAWTDARGNVTDSTYDTAGNLLTVTDRTGAVTTYAYDADDRLDTVTDALGRVTGFAYDAYDRLTQVTHADDTPATTADNPTTQYAHDAAGNVTSVTDERGYQTQFGWHAAGWLQSVTHPDDTPADNTDDPTATYAYDDSGRLTDSTDPLGRVTSYAYDGIGRVVSVTDPLAGVTGMSYDGEGGLLSSTDAAGRTTAYLRDALGRATYVTDALGHATQYGHDAEGQVQSVIDANGHTTHFEYWDTGWLRSTADPLGRAADRLYDANGNLADFADGDRGATLAGIDGDFAAMTYDAQDRPLARTTGSGGTDAYAYDAVGNMLTHTDAEGRVTAYAYDSRDRPTQMTDAEAHVTAYAWDDAGNLASVTDAIAATTAFAYDERNRLTTTTDADNNTSSLAYDDVGNVTAATDGLGRTTSYDYDALDRLTRLTDAALGEWDTDYDAVGNVISSADALDRVTTYDYDALHRLTRVTDAALGETDYAYDAVGNVTSVTDQLDRTTAYEYDDADRLTKTTDPRGAETTYEYSILDKLSKVTDGAGRVTEYVVQADGDLLSVGQVDPITGIALSWSFAYDKVGNRLSSTDPEGRQTTFTYDGVDNLTGVTDALFNTTSYTHDGLGNVLTTTTPLSHVTTHAYDDLSRLLSVTDAEAGVTSFTYDAVGNLTSLTDPVANTTTFAYDVLDRLTAEANELNDAITWTYDAVGNALTQTDRNGRQIDYAYDVLDRLTTEEWLDGGNAVVHTAAWTYDAAGQLTAASDDHSVYAFTYDLAGQLTQTDNTGTASAPVWIVDHGYDNAGRKTQTATTLGTTADAVTDYTYDLFGRLETITKAGQSGGASVAEMRVEFDYDDSGRYQSISRYNDTAATDLALISEYDYDTAGRLSDLTYERDDNGTPVVVEDYGWTWDAAGRITRMATLAETVDHAYDDTNQLTGATYQQTTQADESYSWDLNGNPTGTGIVVGTNNRLLDDGDFTYAYDDAGNRLTKTDNITGNHTEYAWDHRQRLTDVVHKDPTGTVTSEVAYVYDVFDRLIAKDHDADGDAVFESGERYLHDGDHIAAITDAAGTLLQRYLHGETVDQVFAMEDAATGDVLWTVTDQLGTVRRVADDDGVPVESRTYDSFGQLVGTAGTATGFRFGHTGRGFDADAALQYHRARWYDTAATRWASEDPIRFESSDINLSRFVRNSILAYTDPTGKDWIDSGVSFAQGWADTVLLGIPWYIREKAGLNDVPGGIDTTSQAYRNGQTTAFVMYFYIGGWWVLTRLAPAAAGGGGGAAAYGGHKTSYLRDILGR